jgi:aspartyl-tRNA(Asn)/glutamyl-tRNA(Gln) amidotransferase subunit C
MTIDTREALRIAELARLRLEAEELERFASDLRCVLEYMETLSEVGIEGVPPTAHTSAPEEPWREDGSRPGLTPKETLSNAPDAAEGFFRVPRVLPTRDED